MVINNEKKEVRLRYFGDNPINWMFDYKSIRIKKKKSEIENRRRIFEYKASQVRPIDEYVAFKMAKKLGLLVSDVRLVELFVNGKSAGIYMEKERLNESFTVLNMDPNFEYDPDYGSELYRINCSFCHGLQGMGDGTVAPHISSENSFYAITPSDEVPGSGMGPYKAVPQLHNLSQRLQGKDKAMNRLEYMLKMEAGNVGLGPMPSFLWVFTDDQRDQVINYIVDEENGLAAYSE